MIINNNACLLLGCFKCEMTIKCKWHFDHTFTRLSNGNINIKILALRRWLLHGLPSEQQAQNSETPNPGSWVLPASLWDTMSHSPRPMRRLRPVSLRGVAQDLLEN